MIVKKQAKSVYQLHNFTQFKEAINHINLEDQKFLSILTRVKKKINIAKIRTNSHELHSETRIWTIFKMSWDEITCHLCDKNRVEH